MTSTAATALRKLSHYEYDDDLRLKRPGFTTTHLDHVGVGSSCSMEYPAGVCPPSARAYHYSMSALAIGSCMLSRQRHQEKWWLGGMFMAIGYFICGKFDEAGSGIQGHNAAFLLSTFGSIAMFCRHLAGSGNPMFNKLCISWLLLSGWYEFGMSHVWTAYLAYFKQEASGMTRLYTTSLWEDFVPANIEPTFLTYRPLHLEDGTAVSKLTG
eukprot:CAMPEP_0174851166 /NCGR_PEP_ID=MMETSP1114-20130205/22042_1 /TAXON_ID=312471 /ORGANISM="Neobodo designis, Strain CCAP 1951/1" /LENGTH=211 /DNA_ID=CAMNT_0016085683 /DNA_START=35 /DNA_END=666 /DNA_ORIENTATION=+